MTDFEIHAIIKTMLSWIIRRSGNTEMVEDKMNTIDKTIDAIAQNIMYATKSCKQVKHKDKSQSTLFLRTNENPQVV